MTHDIARVPAHHIDARVPAHDIYARVRETVLAALAGIAPGLPDDVTAKVEVTPARDPAHGDMATNAALVAAKAGAHAAAEDRRRAGRLPQQGPRNRHRRSGRPRLRQPAAEPGVLRAMLPAILREGEHYGDSTLGNDVRVNVEYVSANPTGPMHIGHCRGAVVGDALANLLAKAGYDVTKEYYVNDAGAQVLALAWAAYWRYLQALGTPLTEAEFSDEIPGGLQYRGEYLIPVGEHLARVHGAALAQPDLDVAAPEVWLDTVRDITIDMMLAAIREDLALLGVRTGSVQLRTRAGRQRGAGRDHRRFAATGPDLRGRAGAAQRQNAGGLGAAAADAVPCHAIRRRRGPPAAQIRRQQHVFRQRHRLPRRQGGARLHA